MQKLIEKNLNFDVRKIKNSWDERMHHSWSLFIFAFKNYF
jgi:hypothetical protein